jgi:hypothetical protein
MATVAMCAKAAGHPRLGELRHSHGRFTGVIVNGSFTHIYTPKPPGPQIPQLDNYLLGMYLLPAAG